MIYIDTREAFFLALRPLSGLLKSGFIKNEEIVLF